MFDNTTITLNLKKGTAEGPRTIEIYNWSGKALATARTEIDGLLDCKESKYTGVYFLLGKNSTLTRPKAYIGEAEDIGKRIKNHLANKEFWNQVIAFVSQEDKLNRSNFKYLEGRIIEDAKKIGSYELENEMPSSAKLGEHERNAMDNYYHYVRLLLPILGCNLLVPSAPVINQHKVEQLMCKIKGLVAKGARSRGGFTVFKDSQAVTEPRPHALAKQDWTYVLREQLKKDLILVRDGDNLRFTKDHEFASPSAAAAAVRGGTASGLTEWRTADGKTLKEIDAR